MNLRILDFETHWDKDYSLAKMPTMQYVRDPRFKCLGAGIGNLDDDKGDCFLTGTHLTDWFHFCDWSRLVLVAHNASFDGAVLAHHFGRSPAMWIDTLHWVRYAISQGAAPAEASTSLKWWGEYLGYSKGDTEAATTAGGEALATYGLRDIEITRRLVQWLMQHCPWPDLERRFSEVHVRAATEPLLTLDTDVLEPELAPPPPEAEALRSRKTFAAVLEARGVTPGMKLNAKGKQTLAFAKTDAFMQSLATHSDPVVRELHRLKTEAGSNIRRTRAERFIATGSPMPMPCLYYGAHTGRSTGLDKLNVLNLPQGGFRSALTAPWGYNLLVADYSQIEARVVAWGAGDEYSLDIFRSGEDPYKLVAAQELYNVPIDQVTPEQRTRAKAVVLALGFGQGPNGFIEYCRAFGIEMDEREARRIVFQYRKLRPALVEWWQKVMATVVSDRELTLPSGRKMTYPGLEAQGREVSFLRHKAFSKSAGRDRVNLWHGLVAENWTQATARDILVHAVDRLPAGLAPVLLPYDEIVAVGDPTHAAGMREAMLALPPWAEGLPLKVGEVMVVDNYGEAK